MGAVADVDALIYTSDQGARAVTGAAGVPAALVVSEPVSNLLGESPLPEASPQGLLHSAVSHPSRARPPRQGPVCQPLRASPHDCPLN